MNKKQYLPLIFSLIILCTPYHLYTQFISLESEQQYATLIQNKKPILLQFSASWCGACQDAKQPLEEVAQETEFDGITIARIDVDVKNLAPLINKYQVTGLPTFVYLNNGTIIKTIVGVQNPNQIKESLRTDIRNNLTQNSTPENTSTNTITPQITFNKQDTAPSQKNQNILNTLHHILSTFFQAIITSIKNIVHGIQNLFNR